jgi:hypothetical protein
MTCAHVTGSALAGARQAGSRGTVIVTNSAAEAAVEPAGADAHLHARCAPIKGETGSGGRPNRDHNVHFGASGEFGRQLVRDVLERDLPNELTAGDVGVAAHDFRRDLKLDDAHRDARRLTLFAVLTAPSFELHLSDGLRLRKNQVNAR